MKIKFASISLFFLTACYSPPVVEGFDSEKWKTSAPCSNYRIEAANLLEQNEIILQGEIQKEIEEMLGKTPRHELGKRSEQFFFYPITVDCGDSIANTSLSLRFDALGRVKEIQVVLED